MEEIKEMANDDKLLLAYKYRQAILEIRAASIEPGVIVEPIGPGIRYNGSTIDFIRDLQQQTYSPLDDIID